MNSDHIFVNLPVLLLKKIVVGVDENIDKLCFTLVCKRWYEEKEKYLVFNLVDNEYGYNQKSFKSYSNIIRDSFDTVSKYVGKNKLKTLYYQYPYPYKYYDYSMTNEQKFDKIPDDVSRIFMSYNPDQSFLDMLSKSNVKGLFIEYDMTNIPPCNIPSNITSLSFQCQNLNLVKGSLPQSLKKLDLRGTTFTTEQWIQPGFFPQTLTDLSMPSFELTLLPGTLPASLINLDIGYYRHELQPGILPPNLKELKLDTTQSFSNGVLPVTLESLYFVSVGNLNSGHLTPTSLPNLKKLTIRKGSSEEVQPINLSNIPPTVKVVVIDTVIYRVTGQYPSSVENLSLSCQRFPTTDSDEEAESDKHFKLELPPTITHLYLNSFQRSFTAFTEKDSLPNTIKSLAFLQPPSSDLCIPESVVTLDLGSPGANYKKYTPGQSTVPPTVRELSIDMRYIDGTPFSALPLTVTSFKANAHIKFDQSYLNQLYSIRKLDSKHYLVHENHYFSGGFHSINENDNQSNFLFDKKFQAEYTATKDIENVVKFKFDSVNDPSEIYPNELGISKDTIRRLMSTKNETVDQSISTIKERLKCSIRNKLQNSSKEKKQNQLITAVSCVFSCSITDGFCCIYVILSNLVAILFQSITSKHGSENENRDTPTDNII